MKNTTNIAQLKAEILALHNAGITAHLENNIPFFTQGIADDYLSVSRGSINKPAHDDIQAMFTHYLGMTTFTEYKDLQDPIIGFSQDGSVAWSIAQVKVTGTQTRDDGTEVDLNFTSAWLMLYERRGEEWVRIADASTFK